MLNSRKVDAKDLPNVLGRPVVLGTEDGILHHLLLSPFPFKALRTNCAVQDGIHMWLFKSYLYLP